jgi:hypothetical protein
MAERLAPSEKHTFMHNGRTVYEWDQTLTEVNMCVCCCRIIAQQQLQAIRHPAALKHQSTSKYPASIACFTTPHMHRALHV